MPERTIESGYWNDHFVQPLSFNAKGLYIYSWTNPHCNQAGLYEITMLTMTRETCLTEEQISSALAELKPKVVWYSEKNIMWVKPFVKRQSRSPKFLIAAGRCLKDINDPELVAEYLAYYRATYTLLIPYTYPIDTLSIPSARASYKDTDAGSGSGSGSLSNNINTTTKEGVSKGEETEPQDPILAAISVLYEQNIGILTPVIADQLKWIRDTFPEGWFQEALKEALTHNARKLAYIITILENWQRDGFNAPRRDKDVKKKQRSGKRPEGVEVDE